MPVVAKTIILLVFSNLFMTLKEPVRLNYLWAALCMCGAVLFMFRR